MATFINSFFLFLFFSAVPVLSTISGYLFFKGMDSGIGFYLRRWRSRVRSVLLPMISWNAFVVVLFLAIGALWPSATLQSIIDYDVTDLDIGSTLNALVGVTRHPINFQFWFLHDLLLTVLCTPILGFLIRKAPFIGLLGIGFAWLADYDFVIFFRSDVLFFFYLGGLARLRYWNLDFLSRRAALSLMAVYVVLIALRTLAPAYVDSQGMVGEFLFGPGTSLLRVVGVLSFWGCAPMLMETFWGRRVTALGAVAFFLHAIHWPLNQFIKLGLARLMPGERRGGDALQLLRDDRLDAGGRAADRPDHDPRGAGPVLTPERWPFHRLGRGGCPLEVKPSCGFRARGDGPAEGRDPPRLGAVTTASDGSVAHTPHGVTVLPPHTVVQGVDVDQVERIKPFVVRRDDEPAIGCERTPEVLLDVPARVRTIEMASERPALLLGHDRVAVPLR